MATQDVEMAEVEAPHPLQLKFEDAEELVASYGPKSSPDQGIALYQNILSYGGFCVFVCRRDEGDAGLIPVGTTEEEDAASEQVQRVKEHAIYKLAQLYIQYGCVTMLARISGDTRGWHAF